MSVLQNIRIALDGVGVSVGEGVYPDAPEPCCKIIFTGDEKPLNFMGKTSLNVETFKVVVRGNDYRTLEQKTDLIRAALKNAGFISVGGYEDVEPKAEETFMQLSVGFKFFKQNQL